MGSNNQPSILLTRQQTHLGSSVTQLQASGCKVAWLETLTILPCATEKLADVARRIEAFTHVLFVSRNAARVGIASLVEQGVDILNMDACFLTVGKETAKQLSMAGVEAFYPASGNGAKALLDDPVMQDLSGKFILIVRGKHGLDWPAEQMRQRGAAVEQIIVYEQIMPKYALAKLIELIDLYPRIDAVFLHSSHSATNFLALIKGHQRVFASAQLIVGSAQIAQTVRDLGWVGNVYVAESPSNLHMLKACEESNLLG